MSTCSRGKRAGACQQPRRPASSLARNAFRQIAHLMGGPSIAPTDQVAPMAGPLFPNLRPDFWLPLLADGIGYRHRCA